MPTQETGNQTPLFMLCTYVHKRGVPPTILTTYKGPVTYYDSDAAFQNVTAYVGHITEFLATATNQYDSGRVILYQITRNTEPPSISIVGEWSCMAPPPKTFINGKNKDPDIKSKLKARKINVDIPAHPGEFAQGLFADSPAPQHTTVNTSNVYIWRGEAVLKFEDNPYIANSTTYHKYNYYRTQGQTVEQALTSIMTDVPVPEANF